MNWILITMTYWIACVIGTYIVRNKSRRKRPCSSHTPIGIHIAILLLIPICMPFVLAYCLFSVCKKAYFKNRPIDTSLTAQDVCEKKYESVAEEEKKEKPVLELQDGLPETPHYYAAKCLGEGLLKNDLSAFSGILGEDAILVLNGSKTIRGRSEIISYWEGYIKRYIETSKLRYFTVKQCNYYMNACLAMENMYVLFNFKNELVSTILLTPKSIDEYHIGCGAMFDTLPYSLEKAEEFFQDLRDEAKEDPNHFNDRTPCLHCGCESRDLEWHGTSIREGIHGYIGEMSVCPHCGKVVEYLPIIRIRYDDADQPVVEDDEDLPF